MRPLDERHGSEFGTVGVLRKLLEGLPDDRRIHIQVIGHEEDSPVWSMFAQFSPTAYGKKPLAVLTVSHPQLKRLPLASP